MAMTPNYSPPEGVDVQVIDQAFGPDADLYTDVLKVPSMASRGELRSSFFKRRTELFSQLADMEEHQPDDIALSQRMHAERRMDAVVMAFRILDDPDHRRQYDYARHNRLKRRTNGSDTGAFTPITPSPSRRASTNKKLYSPPPPRRVESKDSSLSTSLDSSAAAARPSSGRNVAIRTDATSSTEDETPDEDAQAVQETARRDSKSKLLSSRRSLRSAPNESRDEQSRRSSDRSKRSSTRRTSTALAKRSGHHGAMAVVAEEVQGSMQDTFSAFDQVFNAFTITEKDIAAVTGRIDKAKRQLNRA